jgi:hypothetical protein
LTCPGNFAKTRDKAAALINWGLAPITVIIFTIYIFFFPSLGGSRGRPTAIINDTDRIPNS